MNSRHEELTKQEVVISWLFIVSVCALWTVLLILISR